MSIVWMSVPKTTRFDFIAIIVNTLKPCTWFSIWAMPMRSDVASVCRRYCVVQAQVVVVIWCRYAWICRCLSMVVHFIGCWCWCDNCQHFWQRWQHWNCQSYGGKRFEEVICNVCNLSLLQWDVCDILDSISFQSADRPVEMAAWYAVIFRWCQTFIGRSETLQMHVERWRWRRTF